MGASRTEEVGQNAIAAYKGIKGAIELALALVLGLATLFGARVDAPLLHVGRALRHGALEAWSIELAALLTPAHVALTSPSSPSSRGRRCISAASSVRSESPARPTMQI